MPLRIKKVKEARAELDAIAKRHAGLTATDAEQGRLAIRLAKLEAEYSELRGDLVRFSALFSKYFGISFEKEVREILVKKQGEALEDKPFGE